MMKGQPLVTASDGGLALVTGSWSVDKHDYIHRLADIFSTGMKNRWRYRSFIELFSGPGRCIIEDTRAELPGSPLQAIDIRDRFTHYFFNDLNPECIAALRQRVAQLGMKPDPKYFTEDCNSVVPKLLNTLPPAGESVELAVIDAWGWEMSFDALSTLTQGRRMDIIVTFPIGFIKRNWNRQLGQLDEFLGGDGYRDAFLSTMTTNPRKASRLLLDYYEDRLKGIGYRHANDEVWMVNSRQVKLYHLVFASKHPRGSDFWAKITLRSPAGQYRLPLPL